jgi:putative ABC transport system permease protein
MHLFIAVSPTVLSHADDIKIDRTVLGFTFLLAVGTGILFGLIPGLHSSAVNLVSELKDAPGMFRASGGFRLRRVLVITQVALAVALLIGAGLLGQSNAPKSPGKYRLRDPPVEDFVDGRPNHIGAEAATL